MKKTSLLLTRTSAAQSRKPSILKDSGRSLHSCSSNTFRSQSRSIHWSENLEEWNSSTSQYDAQESHGGDSVHSRPSLRSGWRAKVLSQKSPDGNAAKECVPVLVFLPFVFPLLWSRHQCCRFRRVIASASPKINYFHYQKIRLQDQSIRKIN